MLKFHVSLKKEALNFYVTDLFHCVVYISCIINLSVAFIGT